MWAIRKDGTGWPMKVFLVLDVNAQADRILVQDRKGETFGPFDSKDYRFIPEKLEERNQL